MAHSPHGHRGQRAPGQGPEQYIQAQQCRDPCTAQENRPEHEEGQEAAGKSTAGAKPAPGRARGPCSFGREGRGQAEPLASASSCPSPEQERRDLPPPPAPRPACTAGGTSHGDGGEEGQHWHRPVSVSFLLTQKTSTKLREAAQLGLSPRVPAPTPSAPHSHLPPLKSALALPSSSRAARGPSLLP